ncbi:hypothetical protein HNP12_001143 [Aeromonas hydrophila]|uniref:hypothetical protein n=1 Tax=Aeromonas hydrophila TaxID=644 RepID=UPI00216A843C|nr:hypothetical protein [Aeromonas hydrophila]MCS3767086.1 hypothetical protein [Aeromonas hydrophila]
MNMSHIPKLLPSGWLVVIGLPSLLMIFGNASSFSAGILISSLLIISIFFMNSVSREEKTHSSYSLWNIIALVGFLFFIMAHFYLVNLNGFNFNQIDFNRFALSYITLALVLTCALLIATSLRRLSDEYFHQSSMIISLLLLFNAIMSLSRVDVFSTGLAKPTFLYLEPSHFALVAAPFISYYCLTSSRTRGTVILLSVVFWAGYIQNLTMLIAALLAFVLSTRKNLVVAMLALIIATLALFIFADTESMSYFNDRLSFSSSSNNLSVLVLYQGWENAIKTLTQLSWLGGGFQQFGITTLTGEASIKLHQLLGFDINQFDGGSTAPKILGEFGIFGACILLVYLTYLVIVFRRIRLGEIESKKEIFASVVLITSVLEFFVRGVGYFSPSLFMFAVGVFYLSDTVKK